MIDFHEIYEKLSNQSPGNQKKITVNSCIEVFFGYSFDGNLRLSFMSKSDSPLIESTSILHVVQGRENKTTYWTSFDLLNEELKEAYFSFCENMVDSVVGIQNESVALNMLRRRFITWKKLFKKNPGKDIPKEKLMGLFGELTALKDILVPKYGINTAIKAWGGQDMYSKDFTLSDTRYEIKTIGANADSIKISSLTQLSSNYVGYLVVFKVESVSPEFKGKCSAIVDVIKEILLQVSDEVIESLFIQKLQNSGIDVFGKEQNTRFDVKTSRIFKVRDGFPRITEKNVPYSEITDVNYCISYAAIAGFVEE